MNKYGIKTLVGAIAALAFLSINHHLFGQVTSWTGGGANDFFSNANNWSIGAPNADIGAQLYQNSGYTVELTSNAEAGCVRFRNGNVKLVGGKVLTVGATGNTSFLESDANVRLQNDNTVLKLESNLSVGSILGDSTLTIEDGAALQVLGQSRVSVGFDSNLFVNDGGQITGNDVWAGASGVDTTAYIEVNSGGFINCQESRIGQLPSADCVARVNGSNSFWQSNDFYIGVNGVGELNVENGAIVSTFTTTLGWLPGSAGTLNLGDATMGVVDLIVGGDNNLNQGGSGTVNITSGGGMEADDVILGEASNATGELNVSGTNASLLIYDDMVIGQNGVGHVNIGQGGEIVVGAFEEGGLTTIGPGSTLEITSGTLGGAELINEGSMNFLDSGFANLQTDVYLLAGSDVQVTTSAPVNFFQYFEHNGAEVYVENGERVNFFGLYTGRGPITGGGVVHFKDAIEPGVNDNQFLYGTIASEGDVVIESTASLNVRINGANQTASDRLQVDGDVTLQSPDFSIIFDNVDQFQDGDEIPLISVGGTRSGTFQGLSEGTVIGTPGSFEVQISYSGGDGNDIVLNVFDSGIMLGDVNLDGVVDLLDVAPFVNRLSTGQYQAEADINADGVVDLLDVAPFVVLLASP